MNRAKGYIPRNYKRQPLGSIPYTTAFNLPAISKSEWPDLIDYKKEKKARLIDVINAAELPVLDQDGFPFCWAYGYVTNLRVARAKAGIPYRHLNPHAIACIRTGYRKRGGNTFDLPKLMAEFGCPTYDVWPKYSMDRSLAKSDAVKRDAIQYRHTEHYELDPNDFEQKAVSLLNDIAVTAGYSHMSHMMCDIELIYKKSGGGYTFGTKHLNSWGAGYKDNGVGQFYGRKAVSFDQLAIKVGTVNPI